MRQGLQIFFLGLDINLDYWPNGSAIRDPLQWIELVDDWASLGLPLVLCLRAPTGEGESISGPADERQINQSRSNLSDRNRVEFLNTMLPMMVARPSVHGMIWRQWQDQDDSRFPKAGFVDFDGKEKPIIESINQMRRAVRGD